MLKCDCHIFNLKKNVDCYPEDNKHRNLDYSLPGDLHRALTQDGKDERCKQEDTHCVAYPCGECSPIKHFFSENFVKQKYPGSNSCTDHTHHHRDEEEAKCIFGAVEWV